jgi:hypothetical protein
MKTVRFADWKNKSRYFGSHSPSFPLISWKLSKRHRFQILWTERYVRDIRMHTRVRMLCLYPFWVSLRLRFKLRLSLDLHLFYQRLIAERTACFRIGDLDFVYRDAMLATFTSCECVRCESGHDSTVCRSHPTRVDAAGFRGSRQPWKDRTISRRHTGTVQDTVTLQDTVVLQ